MPGSQPVWSWEQYRLVADSSSDVVCESDSSGRFVWLQPTVKELLGWDPADLVGVEVWTLVHPDDLARVTELRRLVYLGAELDDTTCRFRCADGRFRQCTVRARGVREIDDRVTGIVLVLRDAHQQAAVLRALTTLSRANEELVRSVDEADLLDRMCAAIAEAGAYPLVWYGRREYDDARTVAPVATAGPKAAYLDEIRISWGDHELGQGPTGLAIRTRATQVRHDVTADPAFRPWVSTAVAHGLACSVALPIVIDGEVDGVLGVWAEETGSFDDLAQALLEDLAADLGYGLRRMRDSARLRDTTVAAERDADRLRATLDSLLDPFVLLESVRDESGQLVDLRYTLANEAAVAYNRMPRHELIGATMLTLFPGLYSQGPLRHYFDAIETGDPMILDDVPYDNEIFGTRRFYDLRGVKSGDGLALTWRDVTERRRAEQELEASRAEYRLLAENASDFVIRTLMDGTIDWASPSVTRALGYSMEELRRMRLIDLTHPDQRDMRSTTVARLDRGEAVHDRVRLRRADGDYHWYEFSARQVADPSGAGPTRISAWRLVDAEVRADEARAESEARFRLLAENASDVVYQSDRAGSVEWISPSVAAVLGWDPDELLGTPAVDLLHPQDTVLHVRPESDALPVDDVLKRFRHHDGTYRWMSVRTRPINRDAAGLEGAVVALRDVHAQTVMQQALAASEELFRTAMKASAIGMALAGLDGRFRVVNESLCALVGRDEAWLLAHSFPDLVHPDDLEVVLGDRAAMIAGEIPSSVRQHRLVKADGSSIWVRRAGVVIRDEEGRPDFIMVQLEDVTPEKTALDELAYRAFHDEVTGLRNRTWVVDALRADLAVAERSGTAVGVLFLDLDNFKVVNDSLGHHAGDEMLTLLGSRLAGILEPGHRLGRFGGDEFVVVVPAVRDREELERVAARLIDAVGRPLVVGGHGVVTSASIGMTISTPGSTPASLLRDTDSALFRAKAAGRARWQLFDDGMHADALERLTVEDDLRRGIAEHELVPYYQPVLDLHTRRIVGHEALVRWVHPTRGVLAPGAFLGVAEESGLIVGIGDQVLELVCRRIAATPGLQGTVGVNVSAVQLARIDWAEQVLDTLARHRVDAQQLVLEVTETAVLSLLDSTRDDLYRLRERGVGLHVDDFGTGYSSIALLRELPVTGLKLDRSFVADLTPGESPANALSQGLASLASSLQLEGVAEGIETAEQAAILRDHGWPFGQGYHFGRPAADPAS